VVRQGGLTRHREGGVQERLAAHRLLSYRLLWFEADPPVRYPELALAAVTTHDLPTIAGLWGGADLRLQQRLGLRPNEEALQEIRERLRATTGVPEGADAREVVVRAHERLAEAPSVVVTATLEDALAVEERPNLPGTTTERPIWSLALPASLEDVQTQVFVRVVADRLGRRRPPQASGHGLMEAP
jgi:4-alpha-glucanotransferase